MENENKQTNKWKVIALSLIIIILAFALYVGYNYQTQQSYNKGYEAGAYFIIGQITKTAQVPYFDNSTGNLTIKYLDLNKKE